MTAGRSILVTRLGFVAPSALAQLFPTNLNEVWATTKENTSYTGFAFTAQRADNSAVFNIPFTDGKHADPSYISNFSGTTALVSTVYGQINGLNATQATPANMMEAFIGSDGLWSLGFPQSFTNTNVDAVLIVADNALLRPANPHLFCLINAGPLQSDVPPGPGFFPPGQGIVCCYSGTGAASSVGRYGLGIDMTDGNGFWSCQNGAAPNANARGCIQWTLGDAHCDNWHVWDMACSTQELRFDAEISSLANVLQASQGATTITYPANTQFNIGSDASFTSGQSYWGAWRLIALYGATLATGTRNSVSSYLMTTGTTVTTLPTTYTDINGFIYTPAYYPKQGSARFAADLYGLTWHDEYGGYEDRGHGPSLGIVNNLTNSATANLVRYAVETGDSDIQITGAQRCERGAYSNDIVPGGTGAIFAQFLIEPGAHQTDSGSGWSFIFQCHYSGGTGGAPVDLMYISIANEVFQCRTTSNASGGRVDTNQGSSTAIVRNVWWAFLAKFTWSASHAADTFDYYLGQNGTTLTHVASSTGAIFDNTAATAYPKQGFYTGVSGQNPPIAILVANHQFSTTITAFDAFITSQPALPAHS